MPAWIKRSMRFAPAAWPTPSSPTCSAMPRSAKSGSGAHVVSQALVVATGVSIDGTREVLGTAVGDSESFEFWREFLASLKARGLTGVHLVISDAHAGLKAAVGQQFTGSSWQRCRVHFMRNLHTAVTAKHAPAVTAAVKTIFAHTDPEEVAAQWDRVADTLAGVSRKSPPCSARRRPTSWRSPHSRKRTGKRSGRTTPSSGSTRRSNAAPMSWRSSPTRQRSYAWLPPWSSKPTTNGKSPAATSPMDLPQNRRGMHYEECHVRNAKEVRSRVP